jgi:ornithine decarboxylase
MIGRRSGAWPAGRDAARFRLHYAVKALPHPIVLSTIAVRGGGFDVGSTAEIDLLQQLGVPMGRCIYTHPVKKPADIEHDYAAGIRTFVVENHCEAEKFNGPSGRYRAVGAVGFPRPHRQVRGRW